MSYQIHLGSNLDILPTLPDNSVDSIVTDPPYELGFMGKSWDSSGIAYSTELWGECLRVLKPGGHLLAFGGSRTWHRLAVAIEDSGFQVRDSIAWLYGSGFPKSLDISKAIDKAAGAERKVVRERSYELTDGGGYSGNLNTNKPRSESAEITAPATPEAQQWEGWGTALKPAFEPVVVARKPLGGEIFVRDRIENELKKLGVESISWTSSASGVKQSSQKLTSSSIKQPKTAETSASNVSVREPENTELKILTSIEQLPSDSTLLIQAGNESLPESQKPNSKSKSLKPMVQTVNAAENQTEPSSHLTTSTVAAANIAEEHQEMSGMNSEDLDFPTVIESFAGIATGLSGSQATVHIQKLSNGEFLWPQGLPEIYKVGNTVAENVLTYGTGGLNIDGSRIGTREHQPQFRPASASGPSNGGVAFGDREGRDASYTEGRWPSNVILDPYTAELLDEQSGITKSGNIKPHASNNSSTIYGNGSGFQPDITGSHIGDSGGASRFFYVAKASKRDRNEGLEELEPQRHSDRENAEGVGGDNPRNRTNHAKQNFHPTVKPTDLMRYLIKLVTPPGGVVLDPFTGSGSTGKAAILEGFDFIGIELTEEYLPIIEGRLAHAEKMRAEAEAKKDEALF